jgi:hypothetical protein
MAACFPSPETKVSSHMKLRFALALSALALPAYAQSLPTPNLGTGTRLNGVNLQSAATKATGTSVADPGTGALENLLPVQTFTGGSHTFVAADLYKETRRSNSGSAMTDTFPGSATAGLVNGTIIQFNNVDAAANVTISAGGGTTINGGSSVTVGPGRSTKWVYDAPATNWRPTMNSLTSLLAANNLSEVATPATARTNLGAAASATTVTAGSGLSGGGDLSANRTLSVGTNAVTNGMLANSTINIGGSSVALGGTATFGKSSNALTSIVDLSVTNTFFDGPSLSLAAGTYYLSGTITVADTSGGAPFIAKLWDGTTVCASTAYQTNATNAIGSITLSCFVTLASTSTMKISVKDALGANGHIGSNYSGVGNTDSMLNALRLY